jgi:hypothetical protein
MASHATGFVLITPPKNVAIIGSPHFESQKAAIDIAESKNVDFPLWK